MKKIMENKKEKIAKEEKEELEFYFPDEGIVVKASSLDEAEKKYKSILKNDL